MKSMQEELQKQINQIWGNWNIKKFLGEGTFGQVYQIEKEEFNYTYKAALKTISIPRSQDEVAAVLNEFGDERSVTEYYQEIVSDIVKEIVLMSKLKGNTNIVSYEDHAVIPNENQVGWNIYIRMELLTPLFQYTKEHPLSVRDVIQLGIDMCKAIEVCQKYNIIHRDIKPENIFVSEMGNYKLGDFGISRQMEKTALEFSKKGTYSYMAPEVYKGKKYNSNVDIYSLGIVLYRFLNNNRLPFLPQYPQRISYNDRNKALIMRISGEKMSKPCNAEGRLAEIVLKACAYDPKERYESAVDMRKALEAILYEQSMSEMIYPEGDVLYHGMTEESCDIATIEQNQTMEFQTEEEKEEENQTVYLFSDRAEIAEDQTETVLQAQENLEEETVAEEIEQDAKEDTVEEEEQVIAPTETAEVKLEETLVHSENVEKESVTSKFKKITLSKKKMIGGIAAVILIAIAIPVYFMTSKITVPNVVNMTINQAEEKTHNGLKIVKASEVYSSQIKRGNIISQQIKVGTKLNKGKELPVVVSKGMQVTMPKIIGMNKDEAYKILKNSKLDMRIEKEEYSMKIKKGCVISQSVDTGKKTDEQTVIEVVLSKGIEQVKVPNVIGKKKSAAIKKIKAAGLKYSITSTYSSSVAEGKIISQNVKANKSVNKGKQIKMVASLGKRPAVTTERATTSHVSTTAQRHYTTTAARRTTTARRRTTTAKRKKTTTKADKFDEKFDLVN